MTKTIMIVFQRDIPRIYPQISGFITLTSAFHGESESTFADGASVARAKAAKVSMIRLIHKS